VLIDSAVMTEKSQAPGSSWVCGVLLASGANVFFWSQFVSDLSFYKEERAAMCVDGRLMGESFLQSKVGVDDSQRHKGTVTMQCSFPVAVYPCYDDDIDAGAWDGKCRTLAVSPAFVDGEWPRRMEESGITCQSQNLPGSDQCSDRKWSCSSGTCDAYEKSIRLCAGKMRQEAYPCFTIKGEPGEGIREESSNFPIGWLIGGLVAVCCNLSCCFLLVRSFHEEDNCVQKTVASLCAVALCFGVMGAITFIVNAAVGDADNQGLVEKDYKDLAVPQGSALFGNNHTVIATEVPPPEGMHWAVVVAIGAGSIYGCLAIVGVCRYLFAQRGDFDQSACAKSSQVATVKEVEHVDYATHPPQKRTLDMIMIGGHSTKVMPPPDQNDPQILGYNNTV